MVNLAAFVLTTGSVPAIAEEPNLVANPADDIRILDRASELLSDESRWNRKDTRECLDQAQTISLFCALYAASLDELGLYDHRRAALEEVRFAIDELSDGRKFEHRLMDFNNLPTTTFSDIKQVLAMARASITARSPSVEPAQHTAPRDRVKKRGA